MTYDDASLRFQIYGAFCLTAALLSIVACYTGHRVIELLLFFAALIFWFPAYKWISIREAIEKRDGR